MAVVPPDTVPDQPWWRRTANLTDYWLTVYRRTWRGSVINSFLTPLLYVLAMGVLLGSFIDAGPSTLDGAPTYLAFVVPGLLAAQTMMMAFGESTYPVMGGLKWQRRSRLWSPRRWVCPRWSWPTSRSSWRGCWSPRRSSSW